MNRTVCRSLAAAAAMLTLVAAAPQTPPPPALSESIDVSLVNVDVVVTDKAGNHVHGLTRDDFAIYEDGKPQPITNFAEYRDAVASEHVSVDAPAAAAPAPDPPPPAQPRTFVVFVDNFYLARMWTEPVFRSLKELLHKVVRPNDSVAVVSFELGVDGALEYTSDLAKIDARLDELVERRARPFIDDPSDLEVANDEAQLRQFDRMVAQAPGMRRDGLSTISMTETVFAARHAKMREKQKIAALEALMSTMAGAPGRKTLLLLSHRLSNVAGLEYMLTEDVVRPSLRSEFLMYEELDGLAKAANTYGVTLYPFFIEGLTHDLPTAASASPMNNAAAEKTWLNEMTALNDLADRTGGVTDSGTLAIAKLLPRLADDFTDYYSIAYRKPATKNAARTLVVKTKNDAYRVRSRQQAVDRTDEAKMGDRVVAELFRPSNATSIRFGVRTAAMTTRGRLRTLPLMIHIPVASLTTLPDGSGRRGQFAVYIVSATKRGAISDVTRRVQPFTIPERELEKAKSTSFTYDLEVRVTETTDRLAIGVVDEISKDYGLGRIFLQKPNAPGAR